MFKRVIINKSESHSVMVTLYKSFKSIFLKFRNKISFEILEASFLQWFNFRVESKYFIGLHNWCIYNWQILVKQPFDRMKSKTWIVQTRISS